MAEVFDRRGEMSAATVKANKYDPLRRFLSADTAAPLTLSFAQVEQILGAKLPPSAYVRAAWWSNETDPTHSQCKAWLSAGLKAQLDRLHERVTFSQGASHEPLRPSHLNSASIAGVTREASDGRGRSCNT